MLSCSRGKKTKTGRNRVDSLCGIKKNNTRHFTVAQALETNQILEVQINDQVGSEALFYAEVFLPQECPLLSCLCETCYHWTVRPLLPTLPPMSLVFCQLQFCPFRMNILCRWKLLTALKHELKSHASKLSVGSRGSNLHLAGRPGRVLP